MLTTELTTNGHREDPGECLSCCRLSLIGSGDFQKVHIDTVFLIMQSTPFGNHPAQIMICKPYSRVHHVERCRSLLFPTKIGLIPALIKYI